MSRTEFSEVVTGFLPSLLNWVEESRLGRKRMDASMPTIPPHRSVGRAGVNAARTLFEASDYVFQEVELVNDFGKDAYVDLVDNRHVTGCCVALQIKTGPSFRRASGYAIPIEGHYSVWKNSSVPIAGIVHDTELNQLFWCNISDFLENVVGEVPSSIPVDKDMVLDRMSLERSFKSEMKRVAERRSVGTALIRLCSQEVEVQIDALMDCFAVGRSEPRVLILMRYLLNLLSGPPLKTGINILAHTTPHPDIFWVPGKNWIPDAVCDVVRPHFRWTDEEVHRLIRAVPFDSWQRGCLGQHLYMILREDPGLTPKVERAAIEFLKAGDEDYASRALYVVLCRTRNAARKYEQLVQVHPGFRELDMATDLETLLAEGEELLLFG